MVLVHAVRSKERATLLAPLVLVVGVAGFLVQQSIRAFVSPVILPRVPAPHSRGAVRGSQIAMQSEKVDGIIEEMKSLTLLEASELVKAIEETFGVDASASGGGMVMMAGPAGGAEEEAAPEKTEFDVILKEVPKDKKIAIIKAIRGLLGCGLKEAKGFADEPGKILEGKPKDICEDAKKTLEEAGAVVEME